MAHDFVVDADGHVCEPADLWTRGLPAGMREQGIRLHWNDETGYCGDAVPGFGLEKVFGCREKGAEGVTIFDRAANLIQLSDGTELRTTDARMLQNIKEGMQVVVDFTNDRERNELNSIAPVGADSQADVSPTAGD